MASQKAKHSKPRAFVDRYLAHKHCTSKAKLNQHNDNKAESTTIKFHGDMSLPEIER